MYRRGGVSRYISRGPAGYSDFLDKGLCASARVAGTAAFYSSGCTHRLAVSVSQVSVLWSVEVHHTYCVSAITIDDGGAPLSLESLLTVGRLRSMNKYKKPPGASAHWADFCLRLFKSSTGYEHTTLTRSLTLTIATSDSVYSVIQRHDGLREGEVLNQAAHQRL